MEDDSPDVPLAFATIPQAIDELKARSDTLVVLIRTKAEPEKVQYHHSGDVLDVCFMLADSQRDMIEKLNEDADSDGD